MELTHLQSDSPLRPVDWRWRRAEALRRLGRRAARLEADAYVAAAKRFQDALAACDDEADRAELSQEWPDLYAARDLRLAEDVDPGQRYALEARLLAGAPYEHIARRAGMRVEAVRWYEALFFNIEDRRDNRDYLLHQAVGSSVHSGIAPHEIDRLWKMVGLAHGPVFLDAVIDHFRRLPVTDVSQIESALSDQARSLLRRQALKAAAGLRLRDPFAGLQTLELERGYQEAERQQGTGESRDLLLQGVQALFDVLPWTAPGKKSPKSVRADFRGLAAEPRVHDLLQAAATGSGPIVERLKQKQFPPPPQRGAPIGSEPVPPASPDRQGSAGPTPQP
jgi:hypothetical protein